MVIITIMVKNQKLKTVFVGMSGGVDSSVSAAVLQEQGYNVVGVFIRTWHPDFLECNEEEERRDAMKVAAHLDIPFLTFDFEDVYKKEVADYMISEYKVGRTPNPDVMCNKEVKFGAFLKKALSMGADFVATGHYVQICEASSCFELPEGSTPVIRGRAQGRKIGRSRADLNNKKKLLSCSSHSNLNMVNELDAAYVAESTSFYYLRKSIDPSKDQVYFLWTLKQEQLSKIIFPIGHLKKSEVRILAKKFKLPVAEKKDSQGICFLGAVDLKDFLKHYIEEKKGNVVLAQSGVEGNENGEMIGYHEGVIFYTLGERHGFVITKKSPNDGAYYVVGKDVKKNILYVSQDKNGTLIQKESINLGAFAFGRNKKLEPKGIHDASNSLTPSVFLKDTNWINALPEEDKKYTAQVRYHGEFLPCEIKILKDDLAQIIFEKAVLIAPGQSCVFYDKDICLGGGVVI